MNLLVPIGRYSDCAVTCVLRVRNHSSSGHIQHGLTFCMKRVEHYSLVRSEIRLSLHSRPKWNPAQGWMCYTNSCRNLDCEIQSNKYSDIKSVACLKPVLASFSVFDRKCQVCNMGTCISSYVRSLRVTMSVSRAGGGNFSIRNK